MRSGRWAIGVWMGLLVALAAGGCAHASKARAGKRAEPDEEPRAERGASTREEALEMPWDPAAVRDDEKAPIVKVERTERQTVVPYLYGYPLYAAGSAVHGIRKLRQDHWTGMERALTEDAEGVQHVVERFPELGCTFEGIQESATVYVPWQLTCEVPAPQRFGGKQRPVVGALGTRAKPAELVQEAGLSTAFLGEWHMAEGELERGNGTGYFNTAHGQLGFRYEGGQLASVVYLFDAPDKRWRKPELWMQP